MCAPGKNACPLNEPAFLCDVMSQSAQQYDCVSFRKTLKKIIRFCENIEYFHANAMRNFNFRVLHLQQAMVALQEMAVLNGFIVIYGFIKLFILIY